MAAIAEVREGKWNFPAPEEVPGWRDAVFLELSCRNDQTAGFPFPPPSPEPLFLDVACKQRLCCDMAIAAQIDLITDDPRCEPSGGILDDVRQFIAASREHKGLLTLGQAAKILDVGSNQVSVWVARQRLKSVVVLGVKMVSAGEVVALHRERLLEGPAKGGRGHRVANLSDMVSAAWQDIDPMG